MAGFSGGRKGRCPSAAAAERLIARCIARRLSKHPTRSIGVIDGNILHDELTEIIVAVGMDFIGQRHHGPARASPACSLGTSKPLGRRCGVCPPAVRRHGGRPVRLVSPRAVVFRRIARITSPPRASPGPCTCQAGRTLIMLSACEQGFGGEQFRAFAFRRSPPTSCASSYTARGGKSTSGACTISAGPCASVTGS